MAGPARLKAAGRPDTMDSAQAKSASKAMNEKDNEQKGRELFKAVQVMQPAPAATAEQEQAISAWADALPGSIAAEYMGARGFTDASRMTDLAFLRKWRVGYAAEWKGRRDFVIIPTAGGAAFAREVCGCAKDATKGTRFLFNERALYQSEKPVVIVEGEIDALSVLHAAGDVVEAVGLGGLGNWHKVLGLIKGGQVQARRFIIALDNDEKPVTRERVAGLAADIKAALNAADRAAVVAPDVYGVNGEGYKDANEMLQKNRAALRENLIMCAGYVGQVSTPSEEEIRKYSTEASALSGLDEFLADGTGETPAATGFPGLDEILDGGLYEGLYILFSTPGAGKTTLVLQMADYIADHGRDVLYVTLEMSKQSLQARSLSRISSLLADSDPEHFLALDSRAIMAGRWKRYGAAFQAKACNTIREAIRVYREQAGRVFFYEPQGGTFKGVREAVERHKRIRGCPPVVFVDYLQIMRPDNTGTTDKQAADSHVLGLKQLSRDLGLPIVAISSLNRAAYDGQLDLSSGKESGGIEFTADCVLGFQYLGVGTSDFNKEVAKSKHPREMEIKILKNRMGMTDCSSCVKYYCKWNIFADAPELNQKAKEAAKKAAERSARRK